MIDRQQLKTIADQIETVGKWHIAALKIMEAADEIERLQYMVPEWREIETAPYCLVIISKNRVVGMAFRTHEGWYWERDKLELMREAPDRWMPLPSGYVPSAEVKDG